MSTRLGLGIALTCLLQSTVGAQGRIEVWGKNYSGIALLAPSGTDFIQVAGGSKFGVALRSNGSIAAWGEDFYGQVSSAPTSGNFTQVSAGLQHAIALASDGTIQSWGQDLVGQVSTTPTGTNFIQVAGGANTSAALRGDGSIAVWGSNSALLISNAPGGQNFTQVSIGPGHGLALGADGSITAWGDDQFGMISDAPLGTGFTQVVAGPSHSLALRADGSIAAWGSDSDPGGAPGVVSGTPTGTGYAMIAAGYWHSLALAADGSIEAWGYDDTQISGLSSEAGFVAIAGAGLNSIGIDANNYGSSFCYGDGSGLICPCGSNGAPGAGCMGSQGTGATLTGYGDANLASDSFRLEVTGARALSPGLVLRGANQVNGGLGMPAGSGLLCVGGQVIRSQVIVTSATGAATFTAFQGIGFGASSFGPGIPVNYQFYYRDPQSVCGSTTQLSSGWTVTWE